MSDYDNCPRCDDKLASTGSCQRCGYPKPPEVSLDITTTEIELKPGGAIKKQYNTDLGRSVIVCNLDGECTDC